MAERLKAHAWKACLGKPNVGSNPTLSAIFNCRLQNADCGMINPKSEIYNPQLHRAHEPGSYATTVREPRQIRKEAAVNGFRVCRRGARVYELLTCNSPQLAAGSFI